ncbi:MAG: hypothetical protein Q8N98_04665, partial [bacterium]|nr:hypothetical protein [bacterium]
KVFTSRYILLCVPYLLILASHFLTEKVSPFLEKSALFPFRRLFPLTGIFILIFFSLRFDYFLLTNPALANLPAGDRQGYLEEWSAGQGIFEASRFFRQKAKTGKVLVGTEGFFGTLPDGLQIYVEGEKNITVIGVGLQLQKVPEKLLNATVDNFVYLLVNDTRNNLTGDPRAKLLEKYPKAVKPDGTRESLLLYEIRTLRQTSESLYQKSETPYPSRQGGTGTGVKS